MDFFFQKYVEEFEVAVWSSLDKEKTSKISKSFFGRYYRNLLFVSATNRESYEGLQKEYSFNPIPI